MTDRQLRWRLGIFTVISLALLATLTVLFGSLPTLFKSSKQYTILFDDATGLKPGAPVRRSGVRVGEVSEVILSDADSKVRVRINVDMDYTVRRSEVPTLVLNFLGTDASIDFLPKAVPPGQELDRSAIPPGEEIEGFRPVSVATLINRASEVVPTTQETLNDIRKSMKRLEEIAPLLEQTAREYRDLGRTANRELPDLVKSMKGTSDDVGATARQYRRLGENLNVWFEGNQDKLTKTLDSLQKTLDSVVIAIDRVVLLLGDDNIKNVIAIIKNIRDASDHAPAIAKNIRDASEHAPTIAKNIRDASDQAPAIAKNLREASDQAPAIAKSVREVTDLAPAIAKNVKDASEHFPSIAKNADELLKEARPGLQRFLQMLTKAEAAMADLQKTTQIFSERGPTISKNLDEGLEKLNRTMTDVRELMRVIGQSDGTFKRFLTDPSLYNNIDSAACMIAKMVPRLDRILKDLETFADKLARHPELIGVSGVARPSDGLKDPPKIGIPPR